MSKIGIVTFFQSYNYGVWLQAYATQKYLEKNGFSVEIVNYTNRHDDEKLRYSYKEGNNIKGYFTSFIKSILFGKVRYYNKGFKKYLSKFYNLSKEHFSDVKDMKNVEYDCLIAGSDQIWNPEITSGRLDKGFLLQFGNAKKRISYASSIGSNRVRNEDKKLFERAFKNFNAISVRETFAAEELKEVTNKIIKVVCDPTFLLRKEDWLEFAALYSTITVSNNEKYILTYFISPDKYTDRYINLVKAYSNKFGLSIWAIQFSSYYKGGCNKKILGASIADFIKLMNNAEIVITDSFHGVALSLNLNKNFVAIENQGNPMRTRNLLKQLGISDRIDMKEEDYTEIDYEKVCVKIENMREDSTQWLLNAINEPF